MKKDKSKKKHKKKQDHRPLHIPTATYDKIHKLPKPDSDNCFSLYGFYLRTGIRQKTNKIWSNNNFVSGAIGDNGERLGLGWSIGKIIRTKQLLIELGLIETEQSHNEQGHFSKWFIKLIYFPSKMTIETEEYRQVLDSYEKYMNVMLNQNLGDMAEILTLREQLEDKTTIVTKNNTMVKSDKTTIVTENPSMVKPPPLNAYSNRNINAYKNRIVAAGDRASKTSSLIEDTNKSQMKKFDNKYCIKLYEALKSKEKIRRKVNINKWILQFKKLRVEDGVNKKDIKEVLLWYIRHIGDEFVPVALSAKTFREKFDIIYNAMNRSQKDDGEDDFKVKTKQKGDTEIVEIFYDT